MGSCSLRPFLQSLCCSSPWNYAVFWKLKCQKEIVLEWEDGFCDTLKPKDSMTGSTKGFYLENRKKILSSTFSRVVFGGTQGEYPVGLAVTGMSSASHVMGKGIIGGAAYTGNASWIYSDNKGTDMLGSLLVPEYPEEWRLQFAAGIKTILVLPLTGQGVLQLGSLERVAEAESLVIDVKEKFKAHEISDRSDWSSSTQQSSLLSTCMDNFEEPSTISTEKANEDHNSIHVMLKDCDLFANQMIPAFTVQALCNTSARGFTDTFENVIDSEISQKSLGIIHAAEPSCEDSVSIATSIATNNMLKSYHLDERVGDFPYLDEFDLRIHEDLMNEVMDIHFVEGANQAAFVVSDFDNATSESGNNLFNFPGDCELSEALGPDIVGNINEYIYDSSILTQNVDQTSVGDRQTYNMDMSAPRPFEIPIEEVDMEQLLEAIVANAQSSSDDNSSNVTSCNTSSEKKFASSGRPNQSKRHASVEEDMVPWSFTTSALTGQKRKVSSAESKNGVLANKPLQRTGYDSLKLLRLSKTNKKRVRNEDNQKTRPRDRQLIQERIKELRELVPNSEKCSIGGLLDKTIKHMHFLKGVTNQADKLRRHILEEESGEKIMKTTEVNNGHQNGASWAVELGNEQQMYPIVVKDLDHPGHMLIQMLCTGHARFLEIADVIHRLELTIIKGVMDQFSDTSCARFVVETSGSFHRLDIFWPLMQLLQQNRPPSSCKI